MSAYVVKNKDRRDEEELTPGDPELAVTIFVPAESALVKSKERWEAQLARTFV
jgi:hypothetical protein